jgi:hypothetical protein
MAVTIDVTNSSKNSEGVDSRCIPFRELEEQNSVEFNRHRDRSVCGE